MYGLLGAAFIAGALFLWVRHRVRRAGKWGQLLTRAAEAEKARDLASATQMLDQADALAADCSGILWQMRQRAASYLRANVEYRAGDLDRAAQLAFEQLQEARAVT